jgi:hypothetical protein
MSDQQSQFDAVNRQRENATAREDYLRRQQSNRTPPPRRQVSPFRIIGWLAYGAAVLVFVAFVAQMLMSADPNGPAAPQLPIAIVACCAVGLWCAIGPIFWESPTVARRVRNFVIAGLFTVIVYPLLVALVIELAGVTAALVSGLL